MHADVVSTRARELEAFRAQLTSLAYRMLGSVTEAEDVVQDVAQRYLHASTEDIRAPGKYLTSMTARACIDYSRSARRRREQYVGPWLPEPVGESERALDASESLARAESISMAFLVMLQTLSPLERAAFVLHDVLDYEYEDVARVLEKSESACRQLASRARSHLRGGKPRFEAPAAATRRLTEEFIEAARGGDVASLVRLLSDDAKLWVDGGGKTSAAIKPVEGARRVARYWVGLFKKCPSLEIRIEDVNGAPAIVLYDRGRIDSAITFGVRGGSVCEIYSQRNPDKLTHLPG